MEQFPTKKSDSFAIILVCVTDQTSSKRLIHAGHVLRKQQGGALRVLSVQPQDHQHSQGEALEMLFHESKKVGAEMTVYYNDHPEEMIASFIEKQKVSAIVVGRPNPKNTSGFISHITTKFPMIPTYMVQKDGSLVAVHPVDRKSSLVALS